MKKPTYLNRASQQAFTLVEMAIVLVIIGSVLTIVFSLLGTLSAQLEQQKLSETRNTINNVKEALLGYAMTNGRFPCPAAAPSSGVTAVEAFAASGTVTNGKCSVFYNGYVPAVTLGLSPTDTSGYVLDGWNNPVRYAIVDLSDDSNATYIFTKSSGMKNANSASCPTCGMSWITTQTLLSVCNTGTGISSGLCASTTATINNNSAIVIYSTAANTATGGTGTDEAANLNSDKAFVSHVPYAAGSTNGEFDDIMEWISPNTIFSRLMQANQLP